MLCGHEELNAEIAFGQRIMEAGRVKRTCKPSPQEAAAGSLRYKETLFLKGLEEGKGRA